MAKSDDHYYSVAEFGSFLYWRLPILPISVEESRSDLYPIISPSKDECVLSVVGESDSDDVTSGSGSDWSADDEADETDLDLAQSSGKSVWNGVQLDRAPVSLHLQLTIESYQLRLQIAVSPFLADRVTCRCASSWELEHPRAVHTSLPASCFLHNPVVYTWRTGCCSASYPEGYLL